ncbi:hypothetical protein JMJ35_003279 [Cladonia borealis]|uniref:Uncharacterized protein n=1 Tax=Cladonia borealis TaxID=184061 RepID=A0AA39V3N4_9LECA|nr:hypothetical protein JMJ35_003279 [Cladonia borealis]
MAVFPPEVLAEICQHFENDKNTLRTLRLVNAFLAVEASRYLYKTLLVYQIDRSWKKLHFVSQCQHLTHYTEELELATLEYLPVYADFETWKLATLGARLVAQRYSSSLAGAAAVMSEADLYGSYCEWQDGEQNLLDVMTAAARGALSFRVVKFPNLHTIKSLGAHELWPSTPQGPTNRRARETAVLRSKNPDAGTCKRMSAHFCFALEVFRLSGTLGSNIVSLELHRYREILYGQTFSIPALRELQNLTLSFPSGPEEIIYSSMRGPWKLAHWLRDAQELKTLRILTQDLENWACHGYRDVVRLFQDAAWPKLRNIQFNEAFMTSKYLLPFLKKHLDKLESLCIEEPIVKKDDWQELADKIRVIFAATTCDLRLTDPHPAAEDELYLDDHDENNFCTTETHPYCNLYWEVRELDRDSLGDDSLGDDSLGDDSLAGDTL